MKSTRKTPVLARIFRLNCLKVVVFAGVLSFGASWAQVQQPEPPLPAPEIAQRLKKLESELRCLVCQNQTLAESPAGLAGDLRREVRALVETGKSDDEVKAFLKARYGDFVLYKPPVSEKTWLLWFGPFALLAVGGMLLMVVVTRNRRRSIEPTGAAVNIAGDEGSDGARGQLALARAMLSDRGNETQSGRVLTEDADIAHVLRSCRTVAVVGLSDKPERASYRVAAFLQARGMRIVPVNPALVGRSVPVLGETAYGSIADIPADIAIDMVDCFRKPEDILAIAHEAVARTGVKCLWMQLDIVNPEAAAVATRAGIDVVMDRCPKIEYARLLAN